MTRATANRRRVTRLPAMGLCAAVCLFAISARAAQPPITALAFTPDGKSVLVGSQAGLVVRSWPQLREQKTIATAVVNLHDLAFSPSGKLLAIAGGTPAEEGLVEVFSWPGGKKLFTCSEHTDSVLEVAWQSDDALITASLDHTLIRWDVKQRKAVERFTGHSRGITSLCLLPEQQVLVSSGIDHNLRVWSLADSKLLRALNNHTRAVNDVALRPAEGLPMIASVSGDRTVRLWQPTIGRMVRFAQLKAIPLAVDWLPDGSHVVVTATDGRVRLIDPDTVQVVQTLPAVDDWAYSLGVHPDGSLLIGGRNGQLKRVAVELPAP